MIAASLATACGEAGESAARLRGPPAPQYQYRRAAAFSLADARGGRVDSRRLSGVPHAVTFLYTRCTDNCPLIGAVLRRALADLGPRARRVAVVAISVDPRHDTAAAVRRWLGRHREPRSFHYLIGTERQLTSVWDHYSVDGQDPRYSNDTHSAGIYLVDRHQRTRAFYTARAGIRPGDIAHDLRALLDER